MEITINLRTISGIVAIIAVIIGVIEGLNVVSLSGIVPDFVFYGSLAIIIAILGILGIYISKMNIKIAAIQYMILGIGLFIIIGNYGVIGCVMFIVAGVLAIVEYMQTKPEVIDNDKKITLIPVLTVIIIILFLLITAGLGVLDSMTASDSVSLSGLSASISNEYGTTSGDLTGTLNIDKDFDYVEVKVVYYNSNNITLYDSIAYNGNNVHPGNYSFDGFYYGNEMPTRAVVEVYDDIQGDPIYTQNVNIN
ncbi:hypothetical protein [uncultured Methanobrevibacter sp.]|uniref:hypothetical protein n=1 Tax=uncultured Methanobrevibacter sp. TaxID=253161 RepID=UPI002608F262|nr:hypothetical protein [uncultured Methanobrevibacter sp.]